jgi:hypothetical protein
MELGAYFAAPHESGYVKGDINAVISRVRSREFSAVQAADGRAPMAYLEADAEKIPLDVACYLERSWRVYPAVHRAENDSPAADLRPPGRWTPVRPLCRMNSST